MAEEKTILLPELFCEVENMSVFYNLKRAIDSTNNVYIKGKAGVPTYGTPDIRWEQITFIKSEKLIYTRGVLYGKTDSNITENDITGGYYVDLGLPSGLKWATCNLGATSPCEYGLLYQFGRVDGYAYGDENNQFRNTSQNKEDTGSQYIPKTASGKIYKTGEVLDPADDAAYVASNGVMRMPTIEEYQELLDNTTNEWVSCNVMGGDHTSHNVMGRLFTSTKNNKKLFFPAAGYFFTINSSYGTAGTHGHYWSSSVDDSNIDNGKDLRFESGRFESGSEHAGSEKCYLDSNVRFFGFPIRGVLNKK